MRNCVIALGAVFALTMAGCSTEGGAAIVVNDQAQEVAFGVARPDEPTTKTLTLVKPFVPGADVSLVGFIGPFLPAAGAIPTAASTGIDFPLAITFNPALLTGAGNTVAQGSITLRYEPVGGGQAVDRVYNFTGVVEDPEITLTTPELNFGRAAIGERPSQVVQVFNPNQTTPVKITTVDYVGDPEIAINLTGLPLPLIIPPQESRRVPVIYTPATVGVVSNGTVILGTDIGDSLAGLGPALQATVRGEGMTGQDVLIEIFGPDDTFSLDGSGLSPVIKFDLPPEAVSISIYASQDPGGVCLDILRFWHDDDGDGALDTDEKVYTDDFFGPWQWVRNFPNGLPGSGFFGVAESISTQLPNSDATDAQLVPGNGQYCLIFRGQPNADLSLHVTIQKRNGGNVSEGTLKLNILFADALPVDTTNFDDPFNPAAATLQTALARCDAILATAGVRIGEIMYWDLPAAGFSTYDDLPSISDVNSALEDCLFDVSFVGTNPPVGFADGERLNIVVCDSLGGGDIDASAFCQPGGVPSPKANTTQFLFLTRHSGTALQLTGLSSDELAYALAHCIGANMGLLQTVGGAGFPFDIITDTLECPAIGTNDTCTTEGANYVMHPFFLGNSQTVITAGQRRVITRNMYMCPGRPLVPLFPGVLTGN